MKYTYVAPCLLGIEGLLKQELIKLGAQNVKPQNGRVLFNGDANILARANICCRYAERILIEVGNFQACTFEELFENVKNLPWENYIPKDALFPVKGSSLNSTLSSIPSIQSITKKAIVERLKQKYNTTWFTESGNLYQIQFFILKNAVSVMIDTSGQGLHKRGYRKNSVEAPLKETICATINNLARIGENSILVDPFCGSGTILIEGALMAMNIAPGLKRNFVAENWHNIDKNIWQAEIKRAKELIKRDVKFEALGYDIDDEAIELTKINAKNAGVDSKIKVIKRDIKSFELTKEKYTVICNPPYGERLLDVKKARELYKIMGNKFIKKDGINFYVISADEDFEIYFGRKADSKRKLYNGMIKCNVYMYFK